MNILIATLYYEGKSIQQVMDATGLNFGTVRAEFATLNHFRNQQMENMSENRLMQIASIEAALWDAIGEYQKNMTSENRKKVNELQHSYCNFIV